MMADLLVLGAETQAATSIACAYPERTIIFVSDHDILDGSDLPNVRMVLARPADRTKLINRPDQVIPLCPRWLDTGNVQPLSIVFNRIEDHFPGCMLPVFSHPGREGRWILKGDRWHRPDAPLSGTWDQLEDVSDEHGCGLIYQPLVKALTTIMAVGRRQQGTQLGCMRVFEERFFWDNILQAAETIDASDVVAASLDLLDALDHRGYFALNWLRTENGLRLSSLRPVPRAVFQIFRRGGVDLLDDPPGVKVVHAGLRMVAAPTYVSFRRLSQ